DHRFVAGHGWATGLGATRALRGPLELDRGQEPGTARGHAARTRADCAPTRAVPGQRVAAQTRRCRRRGSAPGCRGSLVERLNEMSGGGGGVVPPGGLAAAGGRPAERDELKFLIAPDRVSWLTATMASRLPHHRFTGEGANKLPRPRHFVTTI